MLEFFITRGLCLCIKINISFTFGFLNCLKSSLWTRFLSELCFICRLYLNSALYSDCIWTLLFMHVCCLCLNSALNTVWLHHVYWAICTLHHVYWAICTLHHVYWAICTLCHGYWAICTWFRFHRDIQFFKKLRGVNNTAESRRQNISKKSRWGVT